MRSISRLLYKFLFDCVCHGPYYYLTPPQETYIGTIRAQRLLIFDKFWEIHAPGFSNKKTEQSASRRRRAAPDADSLAAEISSFFFFFVSVCRNRGLAKSVTAAGGKITSLARNFLTVCWLRGKIALTGRFDVEVEDFWVVGAAQSIDCFNSHIVHRLVLQVPEEKKL